LSARVPNILVIKTSSLGDVVHNLPAITDIARACDGAHIDWVVERAFAAIPRLHPGVRRVIPCELRRWRRAWRTTQARREWRTFLSELRVERYDAIIDTQGLLKSAILARAARGPRYGLDWRSSREPLRLFYDQTFSVPWGQHAVERNRRLCALALDYPLTGAPEYGIRCDHSRAAWLPPRPYLVLLHATSHPRKLWDDESWIEVGREARAAGFGLLLPWGAESERQRAMRLAQLLPGAVVPERLDLTELAGVLAASAGVLGVDTGLTHLAAALGVPTVGIYGATDPHATGVYSSGPALNLGASDRFPTAADASAALRRLGVVADRATTRLGT
jgi:heptosyltransferase-1